MSEELKQFIFVTIVFATLGGITWFMYKLDKNNRK